MHAQDIASRIATAPVLKGGSLRFWGEWFGKPYDNCHKATQCHAEGNVLVVDFDDGGKLTVVDPEGLELSDTVFSIRDATSVRWEWFYYGRPQTKENLYYYEYRRRASGIEAVTNVDWYTPTLAPKATANAVELL